MTNLQIINNKSKFQSHSYHLVDQSPWPFLISWSLFFSAIGAVLSIHGFSVGKYQESLKRLYISIMSSLYKGLYIYFYNFPSLILNTTQKKLNSYATKN